MMWRDLAGAFSLLTILPAHLDAKGRLAGWIFSYFPLVGLLIGVLLWGVAALDLFILDLQAFLVLLVWIILTGGLHLDGFADSCDGLLATVPPERRLEIMKDPRKGSWAVIGLILLLLGKWLAIREVLFVAVMDKQVSLSLLILPPVMGRWALVLAAYFFPSARKDGSGDYFKHGLGWGQLVVTSLIAVSVAAFFRLPAGALVMLVPLLVLLLGRWAAWRLGGGLTGDVYGMLCEVTELVCLLILGAL